MQYNSNTLRISITFLYLISIIMNIYLIYQMVIVNPDMGMGRFIQNYWPFELVACILYGIGQFLYERYYK